MKGKRVIKTVASLVMLVMFLLPLNLTATAFLSEKGSVTLTLADTDTKQPVADASVRLYFVAKAYENGKSIRYELVSPYDKANIDTDKLQDSALPVHLAYFAEIHSQPYTEKSTDENGIVVFENLTAGLYLVVPVQSEADSYSVSPFLVSVPGYDSENQKWNYNITASPKIFDGNGDEETSETYISVVKKWVTETSHPESVTIVLLKDFQEYLKVELNADNNWYYRFDNLPKNHVWNVVEENVPDGYTVSYEISSNAVIIINKSDKTQEEGTTKPTEGETEEDKLVQTGQLNWPVPVCAIAGIIIFSMGWAVLNLGRKES